jgi:hypothetical protein
MIYRAFKEGQTGTRDGMMSLFRAVIRGTERLKELLDARKAETRAAIRTSKGTYTAREIEREWSLEGDDMVPKTSKGRPWPLHFDPELVFEELKKEETPPKERRKRRREEIEEAVAKETKPEEESILERMVRVVSPRRRRRRAMTRDGIKGPDTPNLE